ncbi:hypothetical protein PMAYCL1PPCAC_31562, partial [Pristionchus mayeri]
MLRSLGTSVARLSLGSSLRLLSRAPCSSRAGRHLAEEDDDFNRLDTSRRPLGDQKSVYHQFNVNKMRSNGSSRYEGGHDRDRRSSGGFSNGGSYRRGGYGGGRGGRGGFGGRGQGQAGSGLRNIEWSGEQLNPINKDLYEEHPAVTARSQAEIEQWMTANQVNLKGHGIPRPVFEFSEAPFRREMVDKLSNNFQKPTVI